MPLLRNEIFFEWIFRLKKKLNGISVTQSSAGGGGAAYYNDGYTGDGSTQNLDSHYMQREHMGLPDRGGYEQYPTRNNR